MGSFDHETNLLKRFARKGQCFSTSKFVADLNPEAVEMNTPDIKRNGFNFTDGFGYISESLSNKIAQVEFRATKASAYQIRIAGAKGVLMVNKDMKAPL